VAPSLDRSAVTLDASIWIAALRTNEPSHEIALRLLQTLMERGAAFVQPTLFPIEVAGAMRRRTGDAFRARHAVERIDSLNAHTVDIDRALAADAAALAMEVGIAGADACYVAVSQRHGSTLITLDEALIQRAMSCADVVSPSAWLARGNA
jgi:predicted nucleic acid-binding protein